VGEPTGRVQRTPVRRALMVMAKEPSVGNTKTRLCPPLTEEEAKDLYRSFLMDTLELMSRVEEAQPLVAYWPPGAQRVFRRLAPDGFDFVLQEGAGLGERLNHVLTHCLTQGYQQVVALDSDSPTLPVSYLREAFSTLDDPDVDVVLGPCDDGGYYLIGMKSPHPLLFEKMEMSTPTVAADTLRRGEQNGLRFVCLRNWYDVDTGQELKRLATELGLEGCEIARHTRVFLSQTRLEL
jgi:rSAM/selenodomain-associated transferase 1